MGLCRDRIVRQQKSAHLPAPSTDEHDRPRREEWRENTASVTLDCTMDAVDRLALLQGSAANSFERCLACTSRSDRLLCDVPAEVLRHLGSIGVTKTYPCGEVLFKEGQEVSGLFILCRGRVRISVGMMGHHGLGLSIAKPGAVLGLDSAITGKAYAVSAVTVYPSELKFIDSSSFLVFLRDQNQIWMRIAKHLSHYCNTLSKRLSSVCSQRSAVERLAQLLLEWGTRNGELVMQQPVVAPVSTHKEIGRMIGTTRETASRLLAYLRKHGIAEMRGAALCIIDQDALRNLADSSSGSRIFYTPQR